MNELALFAGAGGGILGGILLGWKTICAVEIDAYAASVLCTRQNDGILPPFPIWDDIRTFDGKPWREIVDVVSGGFPCQDISAAGKGAGINGKRSGLWHEMARVVREVGPRFVLVENSPMLTSRGLGRVLSDLAEMGYNAKWGVFSASDAIFLAGDPALYHDRFRIFIFAESTDADSMRELQSEENEQKKWRWIGNIHQEMSNADDSKRWSPNKQASHNWENRLNCLYEWEKTRIGFGAMDSTEKENSDANSKRFQEQRRTIPNDEEFSKSQFCDWWESEPNVGRMANGVAARVDRLKVLGNGQVPAVVKLAWETLKP